MLTDYSDLAASLFVLMLAGMVVIGLLARAYFTLKLRAERRRRERDQRGGLPRAG